MKNITRINILLPAIIFLLTVFCSVCGATKLQEKGLQINTSLTDGKVSGARATVDRAHGGPKIYSLKVEYPAATILTANVSLTNKAGYYRIELLEKGKPTLSLVAKDGKSVQGSGRISVNDKGEVQYRVTAIKAKGIVYEIAFSGLAGNSDALGEKPKSAGKVVVADGDLALTLVCLQGKNCRIRIQNNSKTKAYRNIYFEIIYRVMTAGEDADKVKVGTIADTVLPGTGNEWPIRLVFGEPPKIIKVALVKKEAVDPATLEATIPEQKNNKAIPVAAAEKNKKDEQAVSSTSSSAASLPPAGTVKTVAAAASAEPVRIVITNKDVTSLRFFESGAESVPVEERQYKNEFVAANIRFINWELNMLHPAPGKKISLDLEAVRKSPEGTIVARQKLNVELKPEGENIYLQSSIIIETPGKEWKPGTYTLEFYSGGEKIATGSFRVI
jgi:hypothetical protein